ncbi:MAG: hypothetical protein ACR2RE_05375 [Geminicoccaceae bacterium]
MVWEMSGKPTCIKVSHLIGRITLIAIAVPMASLMTIPAFHAIAASDFFGASVSLMVVVFGIQLLSIGIRGFDSAARRSGRHGPLDELWHSDKRVYIVRPSHAKIEIRGRP